MGLDAVYGVGRPRYEQRCIDMQHPSGSGDAEKLHTLYQLREDFRESHGNAPDVVLRIFVLRI